METGSNSKRALAMAGAIVLFATTMVAQQTQPKPLRPKYEPKPSGQPSTVRPGYQPGHAAGNPARPGQVGGQVGGQGQGNRVGQPGGNAQGVRPGGNNQVPQNSMGPNPYSGQQRQPDQMRAPMNPGHLAEWLSQHQNMPPEQQEELLRRDPNFNRLPPPEQHKVINQLYRMGSLNQDQRERRLARAEALERLTPQEKMQVNASMQRMQLLPEDRRQQLRKAFRDLRSVPPQERDGALGSAYYRNTFSPDERSILHDLLKVEPYEAAAPQR